MFSLTVLDHVRLDSEHAARNYMVHARAADRLASAAFAVRVAVAVLLAIAAASAIANLLYTERFYQVADVIASGLAVIGFALYGVFGIESRVLAHRALAHRLWILSEQYRALITEAGDGTVDRGMLLQRRDELMARMHAIYERGFGPDQRAFEAQRLAEIKAEQAA
jgi:SMODS and SLOG-associating 2TM effector domain family 4